MVYLEAAWCLARILSALVPSHENLHKLRNCVASNKTAITSHGNAGVFNQSCPKLTGTDYSTSIVLEIHHPLNS